MTTVYAPQLHRPSDRLGYLPLGAAALLVHALIMIPGYSNDGFDAGEYFGMVAFSLVVATIVFVFAVPSGGPRTGVLLGVLSMLAAVAFWTMLALPMAAAAATVGKRARPLSRGMGDATVAMAALAVVATLVITAVDSI